MHDKLYIGFGISHFDLNFKDVDFIFSKFKKIFKEKIFLFKILWILY